MSFIIVNIMPPVEGRGPRKFSRDQQYDAEAVIGALKIMYGDGTLEDFNGVYVSPNPQDQLKAGEYCFTLLSAPQGKTHSPVLAESDHYAVLG